MWSGAARGAPRACTNGRTLVIRRRVRVAMLNIGTHANYKQTKHCKVIHCPLSRCLSIHCIVFLGFVHILNKITDISFTEFERNYDINVEYVITLFY